MGEIRNAQKSALITFKGDVCDVIYEAVNYTG